MRKSSLFIAIFGALLLVGPLASRADAQFRLGGRYRGYGFTPSQVYAPYSGSGFAYLPYGPNDLYAPGPITTYGSYYFGPNMAFSTTYDAYPGLPPTAPVYVIAPIRSSPPSAVAAPASNTYVPGSGESAR